MKIGHPAEKPAPSTTAATSTATTPGTASAAGQAAATAIPAQADASAKIQLSSTASSLLSGGTSGDFDAEKVSRISKSIDSGTFKINPEAIADKLISNAQELISNVKN